MKLRRSEPRVLPETIVALIDVVFFLLVFFMLVGRLDATAPFEVVPPLSHAGTDMPGGGTTATVAADGSLALDGREMAMRHVLPLVAAIERLGARDVIFVVTPEER